MGYVNDTHMSQFIPCTAMQALTGTYTLVAGQTAKTICIHRAANAATGVFYIPIMVPSNSVALKGAKLISIEVDYEITDDVAVAATAALIKIVRNADGAVPTITAPVVSQDLAAGVAAIALDHHKMIVTLTTPEWVDNDTLFYLTLSVECDGAEEVDVQSAVANFTLRM